VQQCCGAGAHEVSKLNELLESFTKKYVQCHQCGNPETRIRIKKEMIYLKCKVTAADRWALRSAGLL
jgi:translation initiation factor 2 beta subunit (eIF-2beta)/eIF-5